MCLVTHATSQILGDVLASGRKGVSMAATSLLTTIMQVRQLGWGLGAASALGERHNIASAGKHPGRLSPPAGQDNRLYPVLAGLSLRPQWAGLNV